MLQVGLGNWGRYWARRMIPLVREVEPAGWVDLDPRSLELAVEQLGIPAERCYTSLSEALTAVDPDAVLVTASLPGHVPAVREALEADRHVLVEKPFAPTMAEARALVELAAARERVLMVSQNYRFFPAVRAVVQLVRGGELGALHEVEIDFRHRSTVTPGDGRLGHRALAQPLLMDMSIHHFDLLRLVLAREATWIDCQAWNSPWSGFAGPPTAVATIRFGDVLVSYRGSWVAWGDETAWAGEWRLTLERGEIWFTSRDLAGNPRGERVVVRPRGGEERSMPLPTLPVIDQAGSLAEFVAAVEGGREPESSGRANLGSLAIALAAVESAERGERIRLSV
jgi:predicted dehydrogenase